MADTGKPRRKKGDKAEAPPPAEAAKAKADRHAPHSMVRLAPDLYRQLRLLSRRNLRPVAWELRRILEDALRAEGLWPPPPGQEDE